MALALALAILAIVALIGLAIVALVRNGVLFAGDQAGRLRAETLARSGLDYAAYEISCGSWLERERPFDVQRELSRGSIGISVSDGERNTIQVVCSGRDKGGVVRKLRMFMSRPDAANSYALCALNFDPAKNEVREDAKLQIGADECAASSVTEDIHVVPEGGLVTSRATYDSSFAGIVPGSTFVMDDHCRQLYLETGKPSQAGRYSVDYRSGTFVFNEADKGRKVILFHDYYRLIGGRRSVLILPDAPLKPESDRVWAVDGTPFTKVAGPPGAQSSYRIDYGIGAMEVSYYDMGRAVRAMYSFLGSRITGPVRANGDIEWLNRNQCFLFDGDGDRVSTSGKFRYGNGACVSAGTEGKYIASVEGSHDGAAVFLEKQPILDPPAYNLNWLRRQADRRRGGSGVYIDNRTQVESLGAAGVANGDAYQKALLRLWQRRSGSYWNEQGRFIPPSTLVDLSKLGSGAPENGLIFAEGNLRVHGKIPDGRRITIVSVGNIYIDGDIWKSDSRSSLALVADKNICVNLSGLVPVIPGTLGSELTINALMWARRGTIGVIPGIGPDRSAVIVGAMCMNDPYPGAEWGKAFVNTSIVFDRSLREGESAPHYLSTVLKIEDAR